MEGHLAAQERVSNPALSWLRAVGLAVLQDGPPAREWNASELRGIGEELGIDTPGTRAHAENDGDLAVGRLLKRCFGDRDEVEVDRIRVERISRTETDEYRKERVQEVLQVFALRHMRHGARDSRRNHTFS